MANNFNVYFSNYEQLSMRNKLLPKYRNENIGKSKERLVKITDFEIMFLTEDQYLT
jgi:hypothetical protein